MLKILKLWALSSVLLSSALFTVPYLGDVDMVFEEGKELEEFTEIFTDHLYLHSIEPDDETDYISLFACPDTMRFYGNKKPYSQEKTRRIFRETWLMNWKKKDHFSAFAIRNLDNGFIGHVALEKTIDPGVAEISIILHCNEWGKGYGKEALAAIINHLALSYKDLGYQIAGETLKKVQAVVNEENIGAMKLLTNMGFEKVSFLEKEGLLQSVFVLQLD